MCGATSKKGMQEAGAYLCTACELRMLAISHRNQTGSVCDGDLVCPTEPYVFGPWLLLEEVS